MTKPRKTPPVKKQGTRTPPKRRNAATSQVCVSGDVLNELREARQALSDAVLNLPFDLMKPLPRKPLDVAEYLKECRDWFDNAERVRNDAVMAAFFPVAPAPEARNLLDSVSIAELIGFPDFGEREHTGTKGDEDFSYLATSSFDQRQRELAEAVERHFGEYAEDASCMDRSDTARSMVLGLRRRALDFVEWLRVAIERLETAFLPRIEIGAELRPGVHKLTVLLAGYPVPEAATEIQAAVARDLLRFHKGGGSPVEIDNADAQAGKIRERIPQLGTDTGRLIRHGDSAYSLHKAMIGRIDGRNSGIRL